MSVVPVPAQHALFGYPVAKSLSPRIHAHFGQQCQIALEYRAVATQSGELPAALEAFTRAGGIGANVTLPLKTQAFALCAEVDRFAQAAGAVNTLVRRGQAWLGANTDGIGLIADLRQRQQLDMAGRRVLMIGAGGAARGVLAPLQAQGVAQIVIANRSEAGARALAEPLNLAWCTLDRLSELGAFDLIVHASSRGHDCQEALDWPSSLVSARTVLVELSYGVAAAPALSWASELEIVGIDGLGMLIEQAAEAFALWHGVRPDTSAIWGELRAEF